MCDPRGGGRHRAGNRRVRVGQEIFGERGGPRVASSLERGGSTPILVHFLVANAFENLDDFVFLELSVLLRLHSKDLVEHLQHRGLADVALEPLGRGRVWPVGRNVVVRFGQKTQA